MATFAISRNFLKKITVNSIFLSFCLCVSRQHTASSSAWGHRTEKRALSALWHGRWLRPVTDSWGISLNIRLTLTIHRVQRRGIKLLPFEGSILSVLETDTSLILIIVLHFLFVGCTTVWGAACTTCNIIPSLGKLVDLVRLHVTLVPVDLRRDPIYVSWKQTPVGADCALVHVLAVSPLSYVPTCGLWGKTDLLGRVPFHTFFFTSKNLPMFCFPFHTNTI